MIKNEKDLLIKKEAEKELLIAKKSIPIVENELLKLLLPKDEKDKKNVILEIRAGTGGEEASLFGSDLLKMYQKFSHHL